MQVKTKTHVSLQLKQFLPATLTIAVLWCVLPLVFLLTRETSSEDKARSGSRCMVELGVINAQRAKHMFNVAVDDVFGDDGFEKLITNLDNSDESKESSRKYWRLWVTETVIWMTEQEAENRKLDLVINVDDPDRPPTEQDVLRYADFRSGYVMFSSKKLDVTEDVCELVYKKTVSTLKKMKMSEKKEP